MAEAALRLAVLVPQLHEHDLLTDEQAQFAEQLGGECAVRPG
jgi:hypothetical protein